jgi:hypothetical protein
MTGEELRWHSLVDPATSDDLLISGYCFGYPVASTAACITGTQRLNDRLPNGPVPRGEGRLSPMLAMVGATAKGCDCGNSARELLERRANGVSVG